MKQVKFFSEANDLDLQHEINHFIKEQHEIYMEEVDIRYNIYVDEKGHDRWTAMVVYGK